MDNKDYKELNRSEKMMRQREILATFSKLGILAFGGPAAHIAMLEEETIKKKGWLSREKFLDFMGATNLIPGPNSTEMVMLVGYERGGLLGLYTAGISFIVPAMLIVLAFAVAYVNYGSLPQLGSILEGVKAAIMAVIVHALYRLFRSAVKDKFSLAFGIVMGSIYLLGIGEIPLLFIAGLLMLMIKNKDKLMGKTKSLAVPLIFLTFLKIGSVLYGSGYVLLAFLEAEFVEGFGALTSQQILDAVAVGQFTPGPVFTTATFIGYVLGGIPGALVATLGIFLPAFVIASLIKPIIPKMRSSKWLSAALDGINIASLVLMAVVSIKLGLASIVGPITALIFIGSMIGIMRFKINTVWLIIGGGLLTFVASLV